MSAHPWRRLREEIASPRAVATLHAVATVVLAAVNGGWALTVIAMGPPVPGIVWVQLAAVVPLLLLARLQWRRRSRL